MSVTNLPKDLESQTITQISKLSTVSKLQHVVNSHPNNLQKWNQLFTELNKLIDTIATTNNSNDINSDDNDLKQDIHNSYKALLSRFPYLTEYWKKWQLVELKINGETASQDILRMAVENYPNSISLWTQYLSSTLTHDKDKTDTELFRNAYKQALIHNGYDFNSHPIWDMAIEFETNQLKQSKELLELYLRVIKENSTDSTTRKAINKAAVGVNISPKVSHRDEYEDMNDKEYEEFIAVEERNKLNDQYNKKLKSFQNNQHAEYIKLTNKLKSLQNYEFDLIDNKLKYIDNLKNYQTNGSAHLYTHNYSDYLRMRSQKRSLEETKDAEDVKQELEEIKKNGGQVASTNTNTNTKPSTYSSGVSELATTSVETPKSTTTTTTTNDTTDEPVAKKSKLAKEIIIIDLPPTVKQSLQEKIVELVENSLGIKDEFLIQVINENLEASNLDNKQELIDELVQVLDEDAESLVNELWDYIETMV